MDTDNSVVKAGVRGADMGDICKSVNNKNKF